MNRKKVLITIASVFVLGFIIVMSLQYCENKRLEDENNERVRIREEKKKNFNHIINDSVRTEAYFVKLSRVVLKPHFERIDSIHIPSYSLGETWVEKPKFDYSKDEYYTVIRISGEIIGGKSHYSDDNLFQYSFYDTLYSSKINAFETRISSLSIYDWNKNAVYPYDAVIRQKKKQEEEAIKIEAAKKRMEFTIDGINVKYAYNEGKSYVYKSSKHLSSEQIVQAIHNIGGNNMNMIQFRDAYGHYADYIYKTQCIVYESGAIYKVINGKPVLAN